MHGETNTPLFNKWRSMRARVSPNWVNRKHYFDKGITVCDQWFLFSEFKKWSLENGYEDGLELDRINNDKGYSPDNCRYVTKIVNNSNRSNTIMVKYNGEVVSLTILCLRMDIPTNQYNAIRRRIKNGWSDQDAIDTPLKQGNYGHKVNKLK